MTRRTHSSIDKLPGDLRDALMRMIVDGCWPADMKPTDDYDGKPRYEDMVAYCTLHGCVVSSSSIGRWAARLRTITRMRQAGIITRDVMKDLTDEKASATQKAVAEMITAVTVEFISKQDDYSAKEICDVAKAMKDCTAIAINSDKYTREQYAKKIAVAAANTEAKLSKAGVDRKLIQEIIDEHLGVVRS